MELEIATRGMEVDRTKRGATDTTKTREEKGVQLMKKILLTILAFIYFALAVRATVHLHDCIDIFSGSPVDIHTGQAEKMPCKNDPKQCTFETEHRINEAALKSYRALDAVMVPIFSYHLPKVPVTSDYNPERYSTSPRQQIPLFIFLRVIRR